MIRAKTEGPLVHKVWATGLLVAALMAASLVLVAKPAHANTFTVTNTNDGGNGSLRKAILDANARLGADTIRFNIPGTGVKTLLPASELPDITDPVVIDGYAQPGAKKNTKATGAIDAAIQIELRGLNAGSNVVGLHIAASNVVVRGLAINSFRGDGIRIDAGTGTRIEGNFLGTDASGDLDRGNEDAVDVEEAGVKSTIGGTTPDKRNLISGNNGSAVALQGKGGNKVQGNLIGVHKDGTTPMGGSEVNVIVQSANNTVGGAVAEASNVIAHSFGRGISIDFLSGNRVLGNSIFSNGSSGILGIDLRGDGRTLNDPKDPDTGANTLQNFPVLSSAKTSATSVTTIVGELDSTPGKTFNIQFFSNPRGEDEGKKFIGQKSVTTGSGGKVSFTFQPSQPVLGGNVTATATNGGGNTSEFSNPIAVGSTLL